LAGAGPGSLPQSRSVGVCQVTQRAHLGVSSPKIRAEFCDHSQPRCKLTVEGFGSIRKIAAGLGVGLVLRAISGGSAGGFELQAASSSKFSAQPIIHAAFRGREGDFWFHDLRHTWASWHVQSGTPLFVLKELGGRKTLEMVKKYAHLAPEHLAHHANAVMFWSEQAHSGKKEAPKHSA
jgi:hypothetical protein